MRKPPLAALATLIILFAPNLASVARAQAAPEPLVVWTTWSGETLDWLREETSSFVSAFGVDVDVVVLDVNELKQVALQLAPKGEAGDVFAGVPHEQIGELADDRVLLDMSSYATRAYLEDLSEQALLAYSYAGKLYGLPMFVDGPALVVNDDLVPELPATYEETMELAASLTRGDEFGFLADIDNFYFAYAWLKSSGGYVFGRLPDGSLDPRDVGLATDGAVTGALALRALRHDLGLVPPGMDYDSINELFMDGRAAMVFTGPWAVPLYEWAGLNISVYPVPPLANGAPFAGFMGVQGVLVNAISDRKVDAANYAKWLSREDAQVSLARLTGLVPASGSALAAVLDDPIIAGFGEALLHADPIPNITEMGSVWAPMATALSHIVGDDDPDAAALLTRAVEQILRH